MTSPKLTASRVVPARAFGPSHSTNPLIKFLRVPRGKQDLVSRFYPPFAQGAPDVARSDDADFQYTLFRAGCGRRGQKMAADNNYGESQRKSEKLAAAVIHGIT